MYAMAQWHGWPIIIYFLLVISLFFIVRSCLYMIHPPVRSRWRGFALPASYTLPRRNFTIWRRVFIPQHREAVEAYSHLLSGVGVQLDAAIYLAVKRCATAGLLIIGGATWGYGAPQAATFAISLGFGVLLLLLASDKMWLEMLGKYRQQRIAAEIFAISSQLLYYAGSRLNLHAKLVNCLPFAKKLRKEWQMLIHEWYEDPEEALHRFRMRTSTDEAYTFAETLNSLRHNDSPYYYDLLRQRIRSYKDKLELAKESRNESTSYILFVLAGIPILNTFRVFIQPWLEEGRKIFESLN